MDRTQALVVDCDATLGDAVCEVLAQRGITAHHASDKDEAMRGLKDGRYDLLVVDDGSDGGSPSELMRAVSALANPPVVVTILSSVERERVAAQFDAGADDVFRKPLDASRLARLALRCERELHRREQIDGLRARLGNCTGHRGLVGTSPGIVALRERLETLARDTRNVWFHGEDGTGKRFAARALHGLALADEAPFRSIDCASLPEQAAAREAAIRSAFEAAAGGTLYLDGAAELPKAAQGTLLAQLDRNAGVRMLAGSARGPQSAVERGDLTPDFVRRVAQVTVPVPALRERASDLPLLFQHFLSMIVAINALPPIRVSPEALRTLTAHRWPGNVRELRNTVEQAAILAHDGVIGLRELPDLSPPGSGDAASATSGSMADRTFREVKQEVVARFERAYLCELLERFGGNVTSAAGQAGMLRSALQRLLRKYGLKSADFRKGARSASSTRSAATPTLDR
ncbi:MAG: sigma-54-dependent Fis family transcriptional regulator [bacterium]|nr:sigma-54-dependent Fis family transcriptional regulator [bacterium]